ncbi:MAG: T9SS type A sorting domain-containing protein [Schleiferiaceae bacterium]|nr:T9SS type A sorting domain-containing protein [Schleiferiaceae bacterium]
MKKVLTLGLAALTSIMSYGQVDVTFQVDMSDYVAAGTAVAANGLRVGGNFATAGASAGSLAMADWSPTDTGSAMTDLGNDVWAITVTFPSTAIGGTTLYKFVNGDWGTNEGTDPACTIATDGCGIDDGSGNINREIVVPTANGTILRYCWDACYQCDGSAASISLDETAVSGLSVYPNPANGPVAIAFTAKASSNATINVFNVLGQCVNSFDAVVFAGKNEVRWNLDAANGSMVANGNYLVEVVVDGEKTIQRIAVSR